MESFWWMAGVLAGLAGLVLALPLLRPSRPVDYGQESALAIYRDQLEEIDGDEANGRIGVEEARAARVEIQRRMLAIGEWAADTGPQTRAGRIVPTIFAIAAPLGAIALYVALGSPGTPDQPLASRAAPPPVADTGDMAERTRELAQRLERDGGSFDDWWLLGQSYLFMQQFHDAASAFQSAAELAPGDPRPIGAYAETLVRASGGRVTAEAELAFRKILDSEPGDPRARYYIGLSAAQNEHFDDALRLWQDLYRDSPPDAPWMEALRQGLVDMASMTGVDPATVVPEPGDRELARAQDLPTPATVDVEALRAQLETTPKDYEGWLRLARGEAARGELEAARDAIARVREIYPGAPFVQQQITSVEQELGLAGTQRGPSQEQVAAAQDMTPEEQREMIAGMVASLAARLEDQPDDLQGWLMLMRSYGVLGDRESATDAYNTARSRFEGSNEALKTLDEQARVAGIIQ